MNLNDLQLMPLRQHVCDDECIYRDTDDNIKKRCSMVGEFAWVYAGYPVGIYKFPVRIIGPVNSFETRFELMMACITENGFDYFIPREDRYTFTIGLDNILSIEFIYDFKDLISVIISYIKECRRLKFIFNDFRTFTIGLPIHVFKDNNENMSYVTIVADGNNKLVNIRISALAEIIPFSYESENESDNE